MKSFQSTVDADNSFLKLTDIGDADFKRQCMDTEAKAWHELVFHTHVTVRLRGAGQRRVRGDALQQGGGPAGTDRLPRAALSQSSAAFQALCPPQRQTAQKGRGRRAVRRQAARLLIQRMTAHQLVRGDGRAFDLRQGHDDCVTTAEVVGADQQGDGARALVLHDGRETCRRSRRARRWWINEQLGLRRTKIQTVKRSVSISN